MTLAEPTAGQIEVLAAGTSAYHPVDPDGFRAYVRDNKKRSLEPRLMSARDAVDRFVADGDYLTYECNYLMRGPNEALHEIIRQKKRNLWLRENSATSMSRCSSMPAVHLAWTADSSSLLRRSSGRSRSNGSKFSSTAA